MATTAHAQAVKSLNKSQGRRRFVFKTFSQRINYIDINVFRSLDKVKAEPSEGSSFFRDCLVEWRELNTAEDFISFYEEMLPFVQTLPLVLLHKELIFSKLESRLQMKARLSLEPILRLIAALSRDLLEDFLPFLSRIVNSLVCLLKDGGEREPEIVEQIFTSWSYIMMYLQKYLMLDIEGVLMDTLELRYYPRDYIQEFMAESMSFLLRNARDEQLEKGIRRILSEVANPVGKSAVAALLYCVMRGNSTSLHSRAERVLTFLLEDSTFSFCDKFAQGSGTLVEVVSSTLERLCEDLEPKESSLVWKCLFRGLNKSSTNKRFFHLSQLLSVLTSVVKIKKGRWVFDYQPMIRLVDHLVSTLMASSGSREGEDNLSDYLDEVLRLMLCIIDGLLSFGEVAKIDFCSQRWASIFALKNLSLLTFVRELLQRDHLIVKAFGTNILSAMNNMIDSSEEVIYLLLAFCERRQTSQYKLNIIDEASDSRYERIQKFLEEKIRKAVQDIDHGNTIDEAELATLWGAINCYPYFKGNSDILIALVNVLKEHMVPSAENIAGVPRMKWQCIFGTVLSSYYQLQFARRTNLRNVTEVLSFARDHNPCVRVLSAVADYMDYLHGPVLADDNISKTYHSELRAEKALEALNLFSKNLRLSNKDIRLTTLRILCHYGTLRSVPSYDEHPPNKKLKTGETQACSPNSNVPELLLSIEETPLTVSTSRKMVNLISRIQMDLSAGRIHEAYMSLVFNGMIGVFHNRFSYLWNPASECLAVLISKHPGLVWDEFVCYFDECQAKFGTPHDENESDSHNLPDKHNALVGRFYSFLFPPSDSTPSATVVSLLLKSLQKVSFVAESRSRQIIPLFLEFLGYGKDPVSVGLFNHGACKGKEWKGALKEWLTLLKLMRNPRSFYLSQFLKDVLQNRLLDDNDAEVQLKALECLLLWRDDFLLPYDQHLRNLISSKDLREELTTWSLSKESNLVEGGHRAHLVSVVLRILMPKVRKLKVLASRKHTSVHHRKAVLSFIAQLDVHELPLFFALLIKPLNIVSEETVDLFWNSPDNSFGDFKMVDSLKYFTVEAISTLSWKKKYGFLHVIQQIFEVFDESHVCPFLDFLMGCVVRLLANCAANLCAAKGSESVALTDASDVRPIPELKDGATLDKDPTGATLKQFKEMRSLCLKIVALVLDKYEDCVLGSGFWDLFFLAVKPLVESFKQEGSSSKKPSSLFLCFLSMSRSHNLVTLLCREKTLIPGIFSILTVTTASEAVKSSVLMFIENLLNLDSEDEKDSTVKGVLVPNIEALICSLHCLFLGDIFKRKLVRYHGEREIKLLKLLSKYMLDPSHARKYLDILLSFLAAGVKDSDIRREALLTVQDILPKLGIESSSKILNAVSPLLVDADLDLRLCICDLLKTLAKIDSSLNLVAKHVSDLNATSSMEIDGLDYDKIANTYARVDADFFKKASEQHTLIILSQGVYNMSSEELTLRHGAYSLLRTFVEFSALVLCQEVSDLPEFRKEFATADGRWTGARILFIIRKFLLKHIGDTINGGSVRKEWIDLLREMVIKIPDAGNLAAFKALCSEDAEVDFFNNIVHLQKHRRARALMRFANVISRNNLPEGVVRNVFVPLFFNMLLDGQDGKDNNVRTACVEALASVSARMGWKSYYTLLTRCFREIRRHSNKKKILLRVICSILDKFHFSKGGDNPEAEDCPADALNGDTWTVIRIKLHKTVFLKIQKLMNSDSENVNVNVNLAALKVLKLLPVELMDSQLPTIVHRISNFLKNRLESTRDEARLALAACLKELGLEYLQFVVRILCSILKRGFELHVLGYTVNFLLSKCLSNPSPGQLDYCLDDLLRVVETDILGDVAEQKEVEKIASKMKETRKCKSFESLKLVAQNVTFRSHAWKLLSPVTAHLQRHLTPKVKVKLENMLDHIAAGIEGNPSVDQKDLFIYIYGLVDDEINKENCMGNQSKKETKDDLQQKTGSTGFITGVKSCSHLKTVFGLGLLHNLLKKTKLDENNEELLSMLDPFVKLLGDCLSSKYEDIVSSSLRCFTLLIRLPLPSLVSQADKVKATLLSIAQSTVNSSGSLVQSCLKLLTVLLRSEKITLSCEQLQMLIQFPMFVDLETDPSFIALALLKAVVKRKLVVPEIYDIVVRIAELMVKSQLESIRKKCSQILLQFLVDYDLSEKRRQQHIDFLLANLRYEHPSGREAVLEMLHAIMKKFMEKPSLKNFLDGQSQMLFVHLVVCLANDDDNKVRSMTAAAIKLLIGSVSPDRVHSILKYCLSWYFSERQQLLAAAAQVLGLFIEVMKRSFRKHINCVLPGTKTILHSAVSIDTQQLQDTGDEASIPYWKEAYYSLVMIEKMLHQFTDLGFTKDVQDIWEMVFELLLHPHAWLRNISCRLLNYYFGALAEMKRANPQKSVANSLLMRPSRLFMVAASLCFQLKAQPATVDVANVDLLTANLVFAIYGVHSLICQMNHINSRNFWSSLEQHEQVFYLKAFDLLDSKKGKSTFLAFTSDEHVREGEDDPKDNLRNMLIISLLKKMGELALENESIQMRIVFNVYKSFTSQISQEDCRPYAFPILLPLYKVCEGFTGKVISDDLKQLAQEVSESIRDSLGTQIFVQIYSDIRTSLKAKREKRRQAEKLMAVVNPVRNAKRKLSLAAKNRANKKRKIMTMKMARWARS